VGGKGTIHWYDTRINIPTARGNFGDVLPIEKHWESLLQCMDNSVVNNGRHQKGSFNPQ